MSDRYQPSAAAFQTLGQFPHCDPQILHKPGDCSYCDGHKDWQALREVWAINPLKAPCPSERHRPAYQAHRWHGNHPTNTEVPLEAPTAWERLNRDHDDT